MANQSNVWPLLLAAALGISAIASTSIEAQRDDGSRRPVFVAAAGQAASEQTARRTRECRRADGAIHIDGRADEPAWKAAPVIEDFSAFWLKRPGRTKTRARLLWDDEFLYFHAEMQDADLYADITEHDGAIWNNDVFELFFKPAEKQLAYYEFEISPANTLFDMFVPSRGSGGARRWAQAHRFHLKTAVVLDGTLNAWKDDDNGWTVEGRIPWNDFRPTGGRPKSNDRWSFALCRYDYSTRFAEPDLTSSAPLSRPNFHRYEDYEILRFVTGE